jgi:hypothetical protein
LLPGNEVAVGYVQVILFRHGLEKTEKYNKNALAGISGLLAEIRSG